MGDLPQLVARFVPQAVARGLELVEIDQQQRTAAPRSGWQGRQRTRQGASVRHAGQGVVQRVVAQSRRGGAVRGGVLDPDHAQGWARGCVWARCGRRDGRDEQAEPARLAVDQQPHLGLVPRRGIAVEHGIHRRGVIGVDQAAQPSTDQGLRGARAPPGEGRVGPPQRSRGVGQCGADR